MPAPQHLKIQCVKSLLKYVVLVCLFPQDVVMVECTPCRQCSACRASIEELS